MITVKQLDKEVTFRLDRKHPEWIKIGCELSSPDDRPCNKCHLAKEAATIVRVKSFVARGGKIYDLKLEGMKCGGSYNIELISALSSMYTWKKL